MKTEKQYDRVKFPENRKLKESLQHGDNVLIASKTSMSIIYINEILNGKRRLTDQVKKAIIDLLDERLKLQQSLDKLTSKEE